MGQFIDMTKWTSTHPDMRWTVLGPGEAGGRGKCWTWRVRCSCKDQTEEEINGSNLRSGQSLSCGCLQRERAAAYQTTHGMSDTTEYRCWRNMKDRCTNPNNPEWETYGGREPDPVTVCDRWMNSFEAFFADMGFVPDGKEIDRKNNRLGYWCGKKSCPECKSMGRKFECRWVTAIDNANNKDTNRPITVGDTTKNISEWARERNNYSPDVLRHRLKGRDVWTVEEFNTLFEKPVQVRVYTYPYRGEDRTVEELADIARIKKKAMRMRLRRAKDKNLTVEEAVHGKGVV